MNSMFSSPAIHVFSQENVGSVVKKPGTTNALSRKPFIDRTVNANSPGVVRSLKSEPQMKKPERKVDNQTIFEKANTDDDLFLYDTYSSKDINDDYIDANFIFQKDTLNILQSYCGYKELKTPPPKFSSDFSMFIKIPRIEYFLKSEDSYEINEDNEESIDNISLPDIDFD
ncbi:uncharacterized protein LOC123010683 [Tribolium madens]|uniref:uncharacterized protein LOC123010683 n=1 Tax=Tribolium madens TaxID=41895 RepID=UPI001CF75084|nr:uncharacterized protein LOC123010683 [Tribolium madens]